MTQKTKQQPIDIKRTRRLVLTGFSMGLADLVPGVSGGTVAFLMGVYDELLFSIKMVTGKVLSLFVQRKFRQAFQSIPFAFLLPLMGGILLGVFSMVNLVTFLLDNYPTHIWSVFFGLVLGSAYVVSKRIPAWNINRVALLALGFIVTFIIVGLPTLSSQPTTAVVFGTGIIASCAMILPGISGSLIMVILGQYQYVISAVADRDISFLAIFGSGIILGLAMLSRLLGWLLRIHHAATITFLIGVMLGSLRRVWPWQIENADHTFSSASPNINGMLVVYLLLGVVGFTIVKKLEKIGVAEDHDDIESKDFNREISSQHD